MSSEKRVTLEAVYANLDKIKQNIQESLDLIATSFQALETPELTVRALFEERAIVEYNLFGLALVLHDLPEDVEFIKSAVIDRIEEEKE